MSNQDQPRNPDAPVEERTGVAGADVDESAAPGFPDDTAAGRPEGDAAQHATAEQDASRGAEEPAAETAEQGASQEQDPRSREELLAALAQAERERDEYLDHLQRSRAEFENYRKRTTRELMEALDRGAEALCADLLGVLDSFGFALEAADRSEDDGLAKGVRLLHEQLVDVLVRAGLEEIPGEGRPFDPTVHEAMLQVDAEEALGEAVDDPVVVEVLRPGYRFKSRVLRPAQVKVAR